MPMNLFASIYAYLHNVIKYNYDLIFVLSLTIGGYTAVLDYYYVHYNHDLIYWKVLSATYFKSSLHIPMYFLVFIVIVKLFIISVIFVMSIKPNIIYRTPRKQDLKQRYMKFIFIRMMMAIENAQKRWPDEWEIGNRNHAKMFAKAQREIQAAIRQFTQCAQKLMWPSDLQHNQSPESLYFVSDEDMTMMRQSEYSKMGICVNMEFIRALINPH